MLVLVKYSHGKTHYQYILSNTPLEPEIGN